ncbi:hypothetical protein ISG33_12715 [Glaciecola sp. MH2013]|uniref:hypothetical protein n=1 Tax=Glaciecola sp. MH2013 TaxID=2785524 RepID=UPI00189D81D2|nr:hypothetical protein [Glaciecola sp. MH2013]MBF7074261.1 hypothetical protein [Glaciecola sp. MH2013]
MSTIQISLLVSGLIASSLFMCYVDSKYKLHFVAWFNGECSNPFKRQLNESNDNDLSAPSSLDKDREIAELKERIQVLERVVTEPAYELNKKLNALD